MTEHRGLERHTPTLPVKTSTHILSVPARIEYYNEAIEHRMHVHVTKLQLPVIEIYFFRSKHFYNFLKYSVFLAVTIRKQEFPVSEED